MALEIERKFLVRSSRWRAAAMRSERMRQGYFGGTGRGSIRVRIAGESAWLNIKARVAGPSRLEYEYPIPLADAEEMLHELCEPAAIDKVRHWVPCDGHTFEVDEFLGDNAGLIVAEIELGAEDEAFPHPDWLGTEITDDPRYYNHHLASQPWRTWPEQADRS
ncbi:MAG TPA: CYTH domain-containing protein [Steroidobacteraceae bacterium]|nr:CYTH domain-containing protein [Steroidobacteraceae bacterium]